MITNAKELKDAMNQLFEELQNSDNKKTNKMIIAKAVQLGMDYKEYLIKKGIEIVFEEAKKIN